MAAKASLGFHDLYGQAHGLKLLLNKAIKTGSFPFRVANHMKLSLEHDILHRRRSSPGI